MDVPESPFLAVKHFALQLVPFLIHLALCLCLHKDEFPLAREHLLEPSEILCLIVCQFQPRLVLHGSLAEVHGCQYITKLSVGLAEGCNSCRN